VTVCGNIRGIGVVYRSLGTASTPPKIRVWIDHMKDSYDYIYIYHDFLVLKYQ